MGDYLTPDVLTAGRVLEEADVSVAGGKVRVRGLSRGEVFAMQKSKADGGIKDEAAWERRLLSQALVQPTMTEDQVGAWQRSSPAGEMEPVVQKVQDLSALGEGAQKSGVPDVRDESGD